MAWAGDGAGSALNAAAIEMANSWHDIPAGRHPPEEVSVIVEIPAGSRNKYELDKDTGGFRLDRVLYSAVHYPGDATAPTRGGDNHVVPAPPAGENVVGRAGPGWVRLLAQRFTARMPPSA